MKFISVVVLALTGSAIAKGGNGTSKATSVKSQCKQVSKLTKLVDLAANTTKLDDKVNGNATKAAAFTAKAADAQTKLTTLTSNDTLMAACSTIFAAEDTEQDCAKMASLESLMKVAANATKLDDKTNGNTTKADAIKAKATSKAADLTALQSNTTLTAICSELTTKATCKAMAKMVKEAALAGNTTALDSKFEGNSTKIAKFQAKAAKVQTKLDALMSNTTLMDTCATLKSASGNSEAATADTTSSSTATDSTTTDAASAASGLQVGSIGSLVAFLAVALAML